MDPSHLKRLAFIKYLYTIALNQSQLPEPAGAAAILTFHDAIELFNQLACEYLDLNTVGRGNKQISFIEYWDLISAKLLTPLPQKESMNRLNKARVALKHHGNLPSKLDIESHRASVRSFFLDSAPLVFSVDFESDISLIDLVSQENTRQHLHSAVDQLVAGELEFALQQLALAFRYLLDEYYKRKSSEFGASPFSFGKAFGFSNRAVRALSKTRLQRDLGDQKLGNDLSEFIEGVSKTLDAMQGAIRILALGINYPQYSRFQMFMPVVVKLGTGDYEVQGNITANKVVSPEDVQFCIDFVIETSLQLQETDYVRPEPRW